MFTKTSISIKKISTLLIILSASILILSACAPRTGGGPLQATEPPAVSHGNEIGGYVDLVDALRAGGATVEPSGGTEQPFFDVKGQVIKVNGAEVQVFEFADEAAREVASGQISPTGSSIGTSMVTWIDQPNFWAKGRVIVLYIGQDAGSIDILTSVLGDPIAQGG